ETGVTIADGFGKRGGQRLATQIADLDKRVRDFVSVPSPWERRRPAGGLAPGDKRTRRRDGGAPRKPLMGSPFLPKPLHRVMDQGGPAFHVQLVFDLRAMDIHGAGADMEFLGDFVGGFAAADELEYFKFTIGQLLHRRILVARV